MNPFSLLRRLLTSSPPPKTLPPQEPVTIRDWSTELGRGAINHPAHGVLPFDGSRATVARFDPGEAVEVELQVDGGKVRVLRVSPLNEPARPRRPREPELSVRLTGLYDLEVDAALEDTAWEKLGVVDLPRSADGWLREPSPELLAVAEGHAGRALEPLIQATAQYFFEWRGDLTVMFRPVWPRLPGFLDEHADGASFWGSRERPALDARYETHALCVHGTLRRSDWESWHEALLRETRHLPMQRE